MIRYGSMRAVFSSDDFEARPGQIVVDCESGVIVSTSRVWPVSRSGPNDIDIVDFGNLLLFPGLVDSHVHVNDPGRDHWERFDCATKAAVAGGTCTIGDMPLNCIPVTTTRAAVDQKKLACEAKLWTDVCLIGGLVPDNASSPALTELITAGVVSVKAFMCHSGIDDYPKSDILNLETAMPTLASNGIPLMVHAELECCSSPETPPTLTPDPRAYSTFLASRPESMETSAIDAILHLCELYNCPIHIVHLSSAATLPALISARQRGLPVTVETCPHYLCFCAEDISDGQTVFKCCPPIREKSNQDQLWDALLNGDIDMIVSDHSPSPPELKCIGSGNFMAAWGGIAGLQFRLLAIWTAGQSRSIHFGHLAKWLCESPANLLGQFGRKGRLAAGYDADFVVWDPDGTSTVSTVHHLHKQTPYSTMKFRGRIHLTYRAGTVVFAYDGEKFGRATGRILAKRVG